MCVSPRMSRISPLMAFSEALHSPPPPTYAFYSFISPRKAIANLFPMGGNQKALSSPA